jgi:uncharacterized SAM-binding protein YcdF (DUF218 family)
MASPPKLSRLFRWIPAAGLLTLLILLACGGRLLIDTDPLPSHVDALVVLQGSVVAERARIAAAMADLQRGAADRVLLSVPKESYWGQSIAPVARTYLERTYGDLAARVDFCETSAETNSTAEEAEAAMDCIQQHRWRSIVIVTSDYHTRRARILWRRTVRRRVTPVTIAMEGVADPEFQQPWWRHRQSAKIWLTEVLKLAWTIGGG